MQTRDVLPDHVQLRRPTIVIVLVRKTGGREIVRQRVEPDPRSLFFTRRQRQRKWYRPAQSRARDRDVLEPLVEERENLIPPSLGCEKVRTLGEQLPEKWFVARETEEPIAFGRPLELT